MTTNPEAEPFQVIAMDFIVKLPPSRGYNSILTITDHDCTKPSIFIPCKESMTSEDIAYLLLQWLYPNSGIPDKVIHDRDTKCVSNSFTKLCQRLGIKQNISSAYHPQTDGQSERNNQWLEQFLRHYCNAKQDNWADLLPIAQFAHNSWPNATTKASPFNLLMGWTPHTTWSHKPSNIPCLEH